MKNCYNQTILQIIIIITVFCYMVSCYVTSIPTNVITTNVNICEDEDNLSCEDLNNQTIDFYLKKIDELRMVYVNERGMEYYRVYRCMDHLKRTYAGLYWSAKFFNESKKLSGHSVDKIKACQKQSSLSYHQFRWNEFFELANMKYNNVIGVNGSTTWQVEFHDQNMLFKLFPLNVYMFGAIDPVSGSIGVYVGNLDVDNIERFEWRMDYAGKAHMYRIKNMEFQKYLVTNDIPFGFKSMQRFLSLELRSNEKDYEIRVVTTRR